MSPHAVSRRLHRLKLGNYAFMRDFLTQQWSVAEGERHNSATLNNASIDVVWDSFQCFLESNGYPREFCSKILLGRLLREAGVEKVKRGPRRRQKFYYFPLRPVRGSRAEAIMATSTDARYVASQTAPRPAGRKKCSRIHDLNNNHAREIIPRDYESHSSSETTEQETARDLVKYDCVQDEVVPHTETTEDLANSDVGYSVPEQSLTAESNELLHPQGERTDQNDVLDRQRLDESLPSGGATDSYAPSVRSNDHDDKNSSFSDILVQSLSRLYDTEDNGKSYPGRNESTDHHRERNSPPASSNGSQPGSSCEQVQTTAIPASDAALDKGNKTFVHDGLVSFSTEDSLFSTLRTTDGCKPGETTREVLRLESKGYLYHELVVYKNKRKMLDSFSKC